MKHKARHSEKKRPGGYFFSLRQTGNEKEGRSIRRGLLGSVQHGDAPLSSFTVKNFGPSLKGWLKGTVTWMRSGHATAGSSASLTMDVVRAEPASVVTETAAYLNERDLKAFTDDMQKEVAPTAALIEAIRQAKAARRA